jgi:lipopolysaccharide/colanic/teichoic acid biosynthesis glycosyltransferase
MNTQLNRLDVLKNLRLVTDRREARRKISAAMVIGDLFCIIFGIFISTKIIGFADLKIQAINLFPLIYLIFIIVSLNTNVYRASNLNSPYNSFIEAAKCLSYSIMLLFIFFYFLKISDNFSRLLLFSSYAISLFAMFIIRLKLKRVFRNALATGLYSELVIFDGVPVSHSTGIIGVDARTAGIVPDATNYESIAVLGELTKGMDRVILHCAPEFRDRWVFALRSIDVAAELAVPELDIYKPVGISDWSGSAGLIINTGSLNLSQLLLKRALDYAFIFAISPALVIAFFTISIMIKCDSKGPIFFRQERIGLGNRLFRIWKFRTMHVDMQDTIASNLTARDDPRVTRIGRFLRKSSLDELPQIFNILTGEMSLVGPRPHAPMAKAGGSLYWEADSDYCLRHVVMPGLTGLAQVEGHRGNTFHEEDLVNRLNSDLAYVDSWSILLDLRIIFKTFFVLFHKNAF